MVHSTEQENFWEGEFGDGYINRNNGADWVSSNTAFFAKALSRVTKVESVLELGSNIGLNLMALRNLFPNITHSAVEINKKACSILRENIPDVDLYEQSILDFKPSQLIDLVFTKGVLIHINPEKLPVVYELIYKASARYLLLAEYYNPVPTEIPYRGQADRLFKRDFAGEMLAKYSDLELVDYGFAYHKDNNFPQDDLTWFLMEKNGESPKLKD